MKRKNNRIRIAIIFIAFAVICFITSITFNVSEGMVKKTLSSKGGIIGPIEVDKDKSVYYVNVTQDISKNTQWSFVLGELLDENKNYLFSFGEEFWKESGYDDGGSWTEKITSYGMKITIPKKGRYYLRFNAEKSAGVNSEIHILFDKQRGSSLPSFIAGLISLITGVFFGLFRNSRILAALFG